MAENINIDIIINAAQSAKTLKEQKEALKELNKALGEVREGSGAFELLTESANELKSTMDSLTLSFEDVYGEGVKPLSSQLGELEDRMYAMAIAGQQNTDEFKALQAEAVKMRKTIIDVDSTVDAFAQKGARLNALVGVVGGITAAFGLAQGAAALFGDENKAIEETLVKVNSVMLILNSLSEIQRLITEKNIIVQGILNSVMKANPIFLLLGVLTAVIGGIKLFISATEDASDAQKELNDQLKFQQDILINNNERIVKDAEARIALAEAQGKSEQELLKLRLKLIDEQEAADKSASDSAKIRIAELQKERTDADEDRRTEITNEIKDQQKLKDAYSEKNKQIADSDTFYDLQRKLLREKQAVADKKAQQEANKTLEEARKKRIEDAKKEAEEIRKLNEKIQENTKTRAETIADLQFEIRTSAFGQLQKQLADLERANIKELNLLKEQRDADLKDLNARFNEKQRGTEEYRIAEQKINDDYDRLSKQKNTIFYREVNDLKRKSEKDLLDSDLKFNETSYENTLSRLNKEEIENRRKIESTIKDSKQKEKLIKDNEEFYFNERKNLSDKYFNDSKDKITERFNLENTNLNNEIREAEINSRQKLAILSTFYKVREDLSKELEKATTDAEKDEIKSRIIANENRINEIKKGSDLEFANIKFLKSKKKNLEENYNKEVIALAENTTEALKTEEEDRTKNTKEQLEQRKSDWEDFLTQAADSVTNLLGTAFNSITQARLQGIEQTKNNQLEALQSEEDAYRSTIENQTNADKFKAAKDAEFKAKRKAIEDKYEREKAEAQYKNEIRQWEYSLASAAVNLANALLKSATNPFLFATTTALGILQLGTIQANKPVAPKFAKGGLLDGPSHANGGIATPFGEMEGGEAVINKKSVSMPGVLPILSAINEMGGGIPLVNSSKMANGSITNINNNVDTSNIEAVLDKYFNRPIKAVVVANDVTKQQLKDSRLMDKTSF